MNGRRGVNIFEALKGHEVIAIPDRDVNDPDFVYFMKDYYPDLFIVGGYSRIFKKPLLDVPRLGTWNCHAGPVPEYRGGSPLNWQIIDGKDKIGLSVLRMDEGIDTGPVLQTATFDLPRDKTIKDAHDMADKVFPMMILDLLGKQIRDGEVMGLRQPESSAYRKQRNDAMGEIDWNWTAERLENFVRALTHPYPGAWFMRHGKKMRVWSVSTE